MQALGITWFSTSGPETRQLIFWRQETGDNKMTDELFVVWRDPESGHKYTIGKLTRGESYTFEYCDECKLAEKAGWTSLPAFPENKQYRSETLFAAFAMRIPSPKRYGIEKVLKRYGLTEYDGFELLKRSTGKVPTDTYEFIG